jgi:mannose-6-phosphate isomerase
MHRVFGQAQHYAWGDHTSIPGLLGVAVDSRPWAEWWMGTHPVAPSTIEDGASLESIAGELPYLLKLLAADEPLSLQTHPNESLASAGFQRENDDGIALDSPLRIYRDPRAKPELLCALTPFDTLCGFRPVDETLSLLRAIDAHDLAELLQREQLAATVAALYRHEVDIASTLAACARHDRAEAALVTELSYRYPGDPSVVVTLLLNRIRLAPGQAVFLGPGNLHAYLDGFGVEIMGSSDNVVRGGLTVKHVDVEELLAVLDYEPLAEPVVTPVEVDPGRFVYSTPHTPFRLWRFEIQASLHHCATGRELLLWTHGSRCGECEFLAAGETAVIHGPATVFRVEER